MSLYKRRLGLTYVGLIANVHAVQQVLPQVLIGSAKDFSMRSFRLINAAMPPGFYFVRRPSKWIDKNTLIWILRMISRAVTNAFPNIRISLLFDAAPIHLAPEIILAARDLRIMIVMIPACLTYLLQPLDVMVF